MTEQYQQICKTFALTGIRKMKTPLKYRWKKIAKHKPVIHKNQAKSVQVIVRRKLKTDDDYKHFIASYVKYKYTEEWSIDFCLENDLGTTQVKLDTKLREGDEWIDILF
jgi:hypothetical protein